ncbi:MAG: hypothetical protein II492_05560, partial [Eubacterium sp.]|nr:hypothetical protein [Eubacterium sp.]
MIKFKRTHKIMASLLAATLMLSTVGCEKKAENIEKIGGEESSETVAEDGEDTSEDSKSREYNLWEESVTGTDFDTVDIKTMLRSDYNLDELKTVTVKYDKFDKDFAKEMCDTIFDSGEVEVYDFNAPTKLVYDDLIAAYKDTLELYDYESVNMPEAIKYAPDEFLSTGNWAMTEIIEERRVQRSEIEEKLASLEAEKEAAPETIENDYSYQGYMGKIGGEDYYMYFGNREYDEYLSSPESYQYNGRVITVMRKDIEDFSDSDIEVLSFENNEDCEILYKKNAIIEQPTSIPQDPANLDIKEDYFEEAESFLAKLGLPDYNLDGASELQWGLDVSTGFLYKEKIDMSSYSAICPDGYKLRYTLDFENTDRIALNDIQLPSYVESGDTLDINSYVDIYVNDKGIIGCQINNPAKVIKQDQVKNVMDINSVMEVVKDKAGEISVWNMPSGRSVKNISIENEKLVSMPIRSTEDEEEYTYVPCYLLYNNLSDEPWTTGSIIPPESCVDAPFLLINAIDG